jgi:hypothetical protein
MSELAALQADFSGALRVGGAPMGLRGEPAQAARRFAVYRNNVRLIRMNALTAVYPVVRAIVGEEFFTGLAREYAIAHESHSGDLNEYGAGFADFLASFAPARDLPYLPDTARLEWAEHRAYYAADAQALDLARLAQVAEEKWADLRFSLHPAAALLRSPWPLERIHAVNQPGYTGEMVVDFAGPESFVLVYRGGYTVEIAALGGAEFAWLHALAQGATLADAVQGASAVDAGFDMGSALQAAVGRDAIVDFSLGETTS